MKDGNTLIEIYRSGRQRAGRDVPVKVYWSKMDPGGLDGFSKAKGLKHIGNFMIGPVGSPKVLHKIHDTDGYVSVHSEPWNSSPSYPNQWNIEDEFLIRKCIGTCKEPL